MAQVKKPENVSHALPDLLPQLHGMVVRHGAELPDSAIF
jgi:hypothetical protein